jgi:hypothetical protein
MTERQPRSRVAEDGRTDAMEVGVNEGVMLQSIYRFSTVSSLADCSAVSFLC